MNQAPIKRKHLFSITCVVLAIVAFVQLIIAGLALAVRMEEMQQVKIIEREVEKFVPITVKVPELKKLNESAAPAKLVPNTFLAPTQVPESEDHEYPLIENEKTARLVDEAKQARIAGDMATALVKLDEAKFESAEHPVVLYELGMVHETMGIYGKAADFYEKVFLLGSAKAGSLYDAAAKKIRDGFEQPSDALGKLSLGRVRIFKDTRTLMGQRVVLSIPVEKAPGYEIDASDIEVSVTFFNKVGKGEIIQLKDDSWAKANWFTMPFDWMNGEEILQIDYQIPLEDPSMGHLLGQQEYYGQVVTLTYQGEVLDVQAWPRDLAARMYKDESENMDLQDFPEFLGQDVSLQDFDPELPLLNPLPSE